MDPISLEVPVDVRQLIGLLDRPDVYPHGARDLEIRQTHISVVALAGRYAYKFKKPVDLGFLDFSTLDRRLHFCREEVRLNRRLAPDVYLGVVPLARSGQRVVLEGEGEPLAWAVKMVRLPEDATLLSRLLRGELEADVVEELARRVASFHADATSGPEVDEYGRWEVVAHNARENLAQSATHVGRCLSDGVFERLRERIEAHLRQLRPAIEERVATHATRDTHGDLHLDHVYYFPDRHPPGDLVVIDCIEFNHRFRYADPVADMAFLVMDLLFHGRSDLAERFSDAYFEAAGDATGRRLLAFYVAYRAAVRGKVEGMLASEREVPTAARSEAELSARAHWLLALSELEEPQRRPCLVLVGGLPGTGKSTLAEGLGRSAGFAVVSSDRVRKELAGLPPETPAGAAFGEGIYTAEWNERTYATCLERARELLFQGERVLVDASFREAGRRRAFRRAAIASGVRSLFLLCVAEPDTVRTRLARRQGGASDADWRVYQAAAAAWEADGAEESEPVARVDTGVSPDEAVLSALSHLRAGGLVR